MTRSRVGPGDSQSRAGSRGQIAAIFGLSIVLFVALCAVVVDISFYWVSTLQAQRAADAAALAGAVYLPGDPATAYAQARASAKQNGYATGVTPVQHSVRVSGGDPSQLDVTVTASVPTFFARVIGITSWPVTRMAKGVYVLPLPMGSPIAYYGVGDFAINKSTTNRTDYTDASVPAYTSTTPTTWTNADRAWATGTSNYATSSTNNQAQQWQSLKIPTIRGNTLDGIVVSFNAKASTAAGTCQVKAELTWNGSAGTPTWTNASPALVTANLTTSWTGHQLGTATSLATWGNNHTWAAGDFSNTNFRVRLTYQKSTCGTLWLNTLLVTVSSHTTTTTTTTTTTYGVNDGATFLASQGGWGAIITKGGNEQNGDAYAPANNGGSPFSGANGKYDPNGFAYLITLPAGGTVKVFDPGFCAMGSNGAGGSLGAGDHWIGTSGQAVSTYYTLWNSNGKPGLSSSWTPLSSSGTLFENQKGYDPNNMGKDGTGTAPSGATSGCDAYHNGWWSMPAVPGAGTYVLQVQTSKTAIGNPVNQTADASVNDSTNAENMWSIEATGGGSPTVYGNGRMTVYNNLLVNPPGGGQLFYLAKIDQKTGAGKTAQIDLFDPGDVSGDATLKVLIPYNSAADTATQTQATFSYTTDGNCVVNTSDACSGSGRTSIKTATAGKSSFNNTWIHITVPLPSNYGRNGLWNSGWWQIRYEVPGGGNDTTTWQVSVSGNPVHLLVP
jgi:hypothetical protein